MPRTAPGHGSVQNRGAGRVPRPSLLFAVENRSADRCKAVYTGDDHMVGAAGAMDNQEVPVLVPAAHDPNVYVVRVKHQVPGQGFRPGDGGTVGVLGVGASAVADDVLPTRGVIEYPVHI